jgi:hypothetical protein
MSIVQILQALNLMLHKTVLQTISLNSRFHAYHHHHKANWMPGRIFKDGMRGQGKY